jgi:hypothetical protein
MDVYARVLRALLADRLKNSTSLDETGRAHFNALASELGERIKTDEAAAKAAAKEKTSGKA